MKKIQSQFQNGMETFIDLFNKVLEKSNYNLNQYVKGEALAVEEGMDQALLDELKELVDTAPEVIREIENKENFWKVFEQLDDYENNNKFIDWLAKYVNAVIKPMDQAAFLSLLDDDSFKQISEYCFENLVLKDIGKKNIDKSWDIKQVLILRKIMFTFVEMVVMDNLSKEYTFDNMKKMFGLREECCVLWWTLVEEKEEKLWRIMMAKQNERIEKKIDNLMEMIEEKF